MVTKPIALELPKPFEGSFETSRAIMAIGAGDKGSVPAFVLGPKTFTLVSPQETVDMPNGPTFSETASSSLPVSVPTFSLWSIRVSSLLRVLDVPLRPHPLVTSSIASVTFSLASLTSPLLTFAETETV